jgi:hypothetical protein
MGHRHESENGTTRLQEGGDIRDSAVREFADLIEDLSHELTKKIEP